MLLKEMLIRQHEINTLLHKAYIVAMNVSLLFQEITDFYSSDTLSLLEGKAFGLWHLWKQSISRAATTAGSDRLSSEQGSHRRWLRPSFYFLDFAVLVLGA